MNKQKVLEVREKDTERLEGREIEIKRERGKKIEIIKQEYSESETSQKFFYYSKSKYSN